MKYIVYLTTNTKSKINGQNKIYIGVHQTKNPSIFDGYLACGIYVNQPSTYMYAKTPIQAAVKKYGPDAFIRTVLYEYDTPEEAYAKEAELVNTDFLKQPHVYNACLGGSFYNMYKPLYQFDLNGNMVKKWDYSKEAYEFYSQPLDKFEYAIHKRHPFLDSYWSTEPEIRLCDYYTTKHGQPQQVHLYDLYGKYFKSFNSIKECKEYFGNHKELSEYIKNERPYKGYYISKKMVEQFIPKPRKQLEHEVIYVYGINKQLIGEYKGKEVMSVLNLHSWSKISDALTYNNGWYKNFYISLEKVSSIPDKKSHKMKVDVYDKYGNFIETLDSVKEVKAKYKVHASKIKNIQMGDKYYKDWIFKYHSARLVNDIV